MSGQLEVGVEYWAIFRNMDDPHVWERATIPVVITHEYKYFYLCEVLPHYNITCPFGLSRPYRMTIDKFGLKINDIIVTRKE